MREAMAAGERIDAGRLALGLGASALGLGTLALLLRGRRVGLGARDGAADRPDFGPIPNRPEEKAPRSDAAAAKVAQKLNRAAGVLATSVLLDSGLEHYRGCFHSKAMYTPLAVSALTLAISVHGLVDRNAKAHGLRHVTYGAAALTGLVGTGFHVHNVSTRPGGFTWLNLFYGAPLGAPAAILLSGLLGTAAERVRNSEPGVSPSVFGLPAGRTLAAITAIGLLGTTGESGLLHFRGAYHNPFMFVPVTVPPVAAALLASTAMRSKDRNPWLARWWLRATVLMGFAGVGFHAFGVHRSMGGWRNWSQNILNGPPLPAPPSFTGLALAGLAALDLLKDHPDA